MNLRTYFSSGRGFWLIIGGGVIVVLILLFAWAIPAHQAGVQARQSLGQGYMELDHLKAIQKDIPSKGTILDLQGFRAWLDEEARIVDKLYTERAKLLDAPLIGMENPLPEDFKDAYVKRLNHQATEFNRMKRRMVVFNSKGAFPTYPWMTSSALPSRDDYRQVRRAYWSRDYLYRRFLDAGVSVVHSLSVKDTAPLTDKYGAMDFKAELDIAPDRVPSLLDKMLKVSPSDNTSAIFFLDAFSLRGMPETVGPEPMCHVTLSGYVLVLK